MLSRCLTDEPAQITSGMTPGLVTLILKRGAATTAMPGLSSRMADVETNLET